MSISSPLLTIHHVSKTFDAIQALHDVTFSIDQRKITALVGDNGAGKSTLVKILSGFFRPTSGEILLEDMRCEFRSPAEARAAGIETVYQDLALVNQLDVAGNVFLGREITRGGLLGRLFGVLDQRQMRDTTSNILHDLHIHIPEPRRRIQIMSGGQRQAVALGRAIRWGKRLLILDEPTAALGIEETEQVLRMIEQVRDLRQMSLLVVSHNMQNVYRIADKIVVLRQGRHVITLNKTETTPQEIVAYITGAKHHP
jgi:simple sugar transport system ATP-binding protein